MYFYNPLHQLNTILLHKNQILFLLVSFYYFCGSSLGTSCRCFDFFYKNGAFRQNLLITFMSLNNESYSITMSIDVNGNKNF